MKKIFCTIIIFLFVGILTGNAQFFKESETGVEKKAGQGSIITENNGGGLFRADAPSPGTVRPGRDEAIGATAPIDDGINFMVACSLLFCCFAFIRNKKESKKKDK